ncbi:hypothetical protein RvY_16663 [Ramazzottius varieornatus]|uniref:UDP-glucuronosyltransferase n=1 Tax=Ramazzottius varieornatus TaxID=947166 RepID=A0A1D1VZB5_RAMVA|nr:hypothetical protein RvY_16663 [Ramazzottius varieornatus]
MASSRKHVLCVSVPAYGHLIPLLELARKLAQHHQITFAVSKKAAGELEGRELYNPTVDGDTIQLHAIEDGMMDDLDDPNDVGIFDRTLPLIFDGITKLVENVPTKNAKDSKVNGISTPVDMIIADFFLGHEATKMAAERHIPLLIFIAGRANIVPMALSFTEEVRQKLEAMKGSSNPGHGGFLVAPKENGSLLEAPPEHVVKHILIPQHKAFPLATGFIVNSLRKYEQKYIDQCEAMVQMKGKPMYCVGPLLADGKTKTTNLETEEKVRSWLETKQAASVVYICFGSVATPKPEQLKEIGRTILQLNQPVIWSLKKNKHGHLPEEVKAAAQIDFGGEGNADKNILILSWAPQKMILAQPNVALFVSHCGWNSTIEGLHQGKPIVAWPQFADQMMNGDFVEEIGAGVVVRDAGLMSTRLVSAEEFSSKVQAALSKKEGAVSVGKCIAAVWAEGGSSLTDYRSLLSFIGTC